MLSLFPFPRLGNPSLLWPSTVLGLAVTLFCGLPRTSQAHSPHDHIEAFDLGPSREHPDSEVLLVVVRGNLWSSSDGGKNWKRISRGIDNRWALNTLAVAPASEGAVWYLGTEGDGVYRSTDDGRSWQKMNEGLVERTVGTIATSADGVVLATTDGRIYFCSADETNWTLVREHSESVTSLMTTADLVLFGDATGRLFRSENQGKDWEEIDFSRPDPAGVTALHKTGDGELLIGFGTAGIFVEESVADSSFRPANSGITDQRITQFTSSEDTLFAVTWNDGVFVSNDSGKRWERRAEGLTTDRQGDRRGLPQFTTLRESESGSLFLAGYDGLFRSGDQGTTWDQILTLPQTLLIDFDISPEFARDRELAAITYWKGAALSRDGGMSWAPINGDLAPSFWDQAKRKRQGSDDYAQIQRFHSIAFSPDYGTDQTIFAGLRNWFLATDDAGESWERFELTQFAEGEDVIPDRLRFSSDFANDGTILFCARYGEGATRAGAVFRSTDRGTTWKEVLRTEGKYMQSLALSPEFAEDGTAFTSSARGGNKSEVFRTTDGGLNWEIVTGALTFADYGAEIAFSPRFSSDRTVWAGTEAGLWRSQDAGDTWKRLDTGAFPEDAFIDMIAISPEQIIVTAKGEGHFESRDGGTQFRPFRPEAFENNHQFNRLWSYSPGRLLKFAPTEGESPEIFAMTGEAFFHFFGDGQMNVLPLRNFVKPIGEVDLGHWRGAVISLVVAGIGALGVLLSAILRWRRIKARREAAAGV